MDEITIELSREEYEELGKIAASLNITVEELVTLIIKKFLTLPKKNFFNPKQ
ncbi:hypothetical protein [Intestinicryptomonas porci]|uniref:CopG family transcriptional regulator n=1 Tax=Intestinicryptomonas porci TaxID=2926320 RepID=A0ABU4WK68_9BACT|nr:hypothetical protein [Opitutales bacterium CLA-KB-P66]